MTPEQQEAARAYSARGPIMAGLVSLLILVGGFGGWSVATKIAGAVVASGQIEVEQNRQVVQHPDGGVVEAIYVKEGDRVEAGASLLKLDGTLIQSELAIVESQFYEFLARRGRLEAERDGRDLIDFPAALTEVAPTNPEIAELMDGQLSLFETRNESFRQQRDQIGERQGQIARQIEGIDAQLVALERQIDLIGQELSTQKGLLDKGLAQTARVLELEREQSSLQGTVGELTASRAESQGRATEMDIELLKLESTRREEANTQLRDLGYREIEMAERRRTLSEQIARLDIRAPVSGIVYSLQVTTPRAVLRAADPVLYVVPQDRPLVIAARIASINVDEIHVGQEADLRFSAFSSQTTPNLKGQIATISADAFTDERTQAHYYRTEITLKEGELAKLGDLDLLPGMPVEAYIKTDDRSPMAYLIKPLADYFTKAFRES
ncbi:MAG: HlyD family type I secretion periplasmic adaptor subunit [Paracoccaceae bacterium]